MVSPVPANFRNQISKTSEKKRRVKNACVMAVSVLQTFLCIVKDATSDLGVPGLRAGLGGILFVLDAAKKVYDNEDDIDRLVGHLETLSAVIQKSKYGPELSRAMLTRIDHLFKIWTAAADEVRQISSRHVLFRFIHCSDVAQAIGKCIQTVAWSIQNFTVKSLLAIEFALDDHAVSMKNAAVKIEEKIDGGFRQLNARLDLKDGRPPHAVFAPFNNQLRDSCLEGTRTDVLSHIYHWIDIDGLQPSEIPVRHSLDFQAPVTENAKPFFLWINGAAGTGKTTIASTVAATCEAHGVLGASFFCSRYDAGCSNPNLVFTTIAYQLGLFFPAFEDALKRVLKAKPDIGYSSVPYQLEELIVNPLRAVGKSMPVCLVVLDGLDECRDKGPLSIILTSLSRYVDDLQKLKILITSRPEPQITSVFKSSELRHSTLRLILHEIEPSVMEHDIDLYLSANLRRIGELHDISDLWPSRQEICALVHLSSGLFIFAATATKYIEDQNYCDPKYQLTALLSKAPTMSEESSPHYHLDQLYTQVLLCAFPNISAHLAGRLKMVLGSILLLREPLSLLGLEQLLNLDANIVRPTLARLHSVVIVPEDEGAVIRLLHPSFFDFMSTPTRCLNPRFVMDARAQHTMLAYSCLDALCGLRRDICEIGDPSVLNSEVCDLSDRILHHLAPHLQYACRHWVFHLENSMISDELLHRLKKFCSAYLLYWIEACSLLGELRNALLALHAAQQVLSKDRMTIPGIMLLLRDCERFTSEFFAILSVSSLQVYQSALLFTPKGTLLRQTYDHELLLPITVSNAVSEKWNPCVRTMRCGSQSVAFSPDGGRIVSVSKDTIRLSDALSGVHLNTLKGHSSKSLSLVQSVAFSADGTRIVSGSDDKTLQLWDAVSGALLSTFRGHSDCVTSVAFSPDGNRILSGSQDKTLRLWDTNSGGHVKTFEGHSSHVRSVAFSPDGTRLVSGSLDNTLRLWDAVRGVFLSTLTGHSGWVQSVAYSADGMRIVSGSDDRTVRLWDTKRGVQLKTLKGHSSWVWSVAFSPDGTRVVSGSFDLTVRLWDTTSGVLLNILKGHTGRVFSVAFSPDGKRIVSGSSDHTVRLWNAVSCAHRDRVPKHSGLVWSVAFSPDGTRVASASHDRTLRLWDATAGSRGKHLCTLEGHTKGVLTVAFSRDGTRVVSGAEDFSLRLWDAVSGAHLDTHIGRHDLVTSVARSLTPDQTKFLPTATQALKKKKSSDACSTFKYVKDGQWIVSTRTKRRLCWFPLSCQPICLAENGARVALGTMDGRVIILDFSCVDK